MVKLLLAALLFMNAAFAADRWTLDNADGVSWNVAADLRLPHADHIEMSGRRVSVIVNYGVDRERHLLWTRDIIWPTLRIKPHDIRGYLRFQLDNAVEPVLWINEQKLALGPVRQIHFNGVLTVDYEPQQGLTISRNILPAPDAPAIVERWFVRNLRKQTIQLKTSFAGLQQTTDTIRGPVQIAVRLQSSSSASVAPQTVWSMAVITAASSSDHFTLDPVQAEAARRALLTSWNHSLVLHTPDPTLNRAFQLAKIRASESIFDSALGVVHSPGGGRFYAGIWANDQAEYAGPFFPFLGYGLANQASLNAYLAFSRYMAPNYEHVPSSLEVEGDYVMRRLGDRGDAAMIAYGASRFALARGDRSIAEQLWPEITWCLEYCRRQITPEGVIASDTDEMEGRLPTGRANLSTSTLAYGALSSGADLARELNHADLAREYELRAKNLRNAIENYFGATVEGFQTYRYYDGNTNLRDWICLPLTMNILDRAPGTINALLSRLWTPDGMVSQSGDTQYWDRTTLYALRGLFQAGATSQALDHLTSYTQERLLREHIPYAVEAHPEGAQAHLSAESALYARVYTEGLFGIQPTGLSSFRALPRLPENWEQMRLERVCAFGQVFDTTVKRTGANTIRLNVSSEGRPVFSQEAPAGQAFEVKLLNPKKAY